MGLPPLHLVLTACKSSFRLRHSRLKPFLLGLGADAVIGSGDDLALGGGQLCGQRIGLRLQLVGALLCREAVLLKLGGLDPQLFHLLPAGEQARRPLDAAAGEAAACVDDLTIQRHHLVVVTQLPGHPGGFVDVVHHHDASQQVRHDVGVAGVCLHEGGGQPGRAGEVSPEKAGLDGIQRQKGGAARILAAEEGDASLGGGFVLHHNVLQSAAQRRLDGHFPARLDAEDGRHRPDDAPQAAGRGGAHNGLDRVLVAVHVLFQLFQHAEALTGGIQLPAQLLLGGIGLAEGGFPALELEAEARPDVGQLFFVLVQQLPVLDGIGEVLLCFIPLGLEGLSVLGEGGQLLLRRLSGGLGSGFRHLCLSALGSQVGHLCPQGVPAGTAGVVLTGQPQKLCIQLGQLCGQLLPCCRHRPGHGAVAFQRGGGLGAVLLPGGDVRL